MDRCALFVDAGYVLADGAMAVHGTRRRESVSWDYAGLLQLLGGLAAERSGLQLLRCYWYEATVEGRRGVDHDALADLPGVKLRLAKMRPGRREGVESEIHRDLATLARNKAVSDAMIVSAEEDLAGVIADVQDLGMRVTMLHITVDGNWTISRALRQECDDIVEISASHLRPYVELISGAEPSSADEHEGAAIAVLRPGTNGQGGSAAGANGGLGSAGLTGGRLPSFTPAAPAGNGHGYQLPPIYSEPVVAEYQRSTLQPSPHQRAAAGDASSAPAAEAGAGGAGPDGAGAAPVADDLASGRGEPSGQAEPFQAAYDDEARGGQNPAAMYQAAPRRPAARQQGAGPLELPPAGPGQAAARQSGPMAAPPPMPGFDPARPDGYPAPAVLSPSGRPDGLPARPEYSGPQEIPPRPETYPAPVVVRDPAPGQPLEATASRGYAVPDFSGYNPAAPAEPASADAPYGDTSAVSPAEPAYRGAGPGAMGYTGRAGQAGEAEPAPGPAAQVHRLPARGPAGAIPPAAFPSPAQLPQLGQSLPPGGQPQPAQPQAMPMALPPAAPPAHGQPLPLGPVAPGYALSGLPPYSAPQPVPPTGQHPLSGQHPLPGQHPFPGQWPTDGPIPVSGPGSAPAPGPVDGAQPGPASPAPGTGLAAVQAPSFTAGQPPQQASPPQRPQRPQQAQPPQSQQPPQQAPSLADAVQSAHEEGQEFGNSVARDAPALWLEAVLARKPRMPSDLEARLLQGSSLPIDFLLHDEVRHALRRGFWDALERARR